ncbi:hypothetical protein T439DRAFT_303371 [Meredithblackwellia eburnea MCA 4105]
MRASQPRLLKLLALPLSKTPKQPNGQPLFYLHAKRIKDAQINNKDLSYASRATNKAADMWSKLGQANQGTWKRRAYDQGEKFMDRIEYEEWALKAIDPAISPKPWSSSPPMKEGQEKGKDEDKVTLLFPPSLLSKGPLLDALKSQLKHREPHHKNAMYKCLLFAPLTFPFAIIPVVPNFPLFYVLWRAWSHWRAWKSSAYLSTLLAQSPPQVDFLPSSALDTIYSTSPTSSTTTTTTSSLLLTNDKVPLIAEAFGLDREEEGELRRAVGQAEERLKQGPTKDKVVVEETSAGKKDV